MRGANALVGSGGVDHVGAHDAQGRFLGPRKGMLEQAGLELDPRGNVKADTVQYQSSDEQIFACGDMRRGQSLVVWAIREGRQCARAVDLALMGKSELPR